MITVKDYGIYWGNECVASILKTHFGGSTLQLRQFEINLKKQQAWANRRRKNWNCRVRVVPKCRCTISIPYAYTVNIHKNAFWSKELHQRTPNSFASYSAAAKAASKLKFH